jgi:hypothetical protein
MEATFKNLLPFANHLFTKACPTILLPTQSYLVRHYLLVDQKAYFFQNMFQNAQTADL